MHFYISSHRHHHTYTSTWPSISFFGWFGHTASVDISVGVFISSGGVLIREVRSQIYFFGFLRFGIWGRGFMISNVLGGRLVFFSGDTTLLFSLWCCSEPKCWSTVEIYMPCTHECVKAGGDRSSVSIGCEGENIKSKVFSVRLLVFA